MQVDIPNPLAILGFHLDETTSQPPSERAREIDTFLRRPASELLKLLNVRKKDLAHRKQMIGKVTENISLLEAYSVEAISVMTGISRGKVSTIRERAKITERKEELGKFAWMDETVEVLASLLKGETATQIAKRLNKDRQNVHTIKVNAISAGFNLDAQRTITAKPKGKNNLMKALFMLFEGKDPDEIAVKLKVCKLGVQVLETIAKRKKLFARRATKHKPRRRKTTNKG